MKESKELPSMSKLSRNDIHQLLSQPLLNANDDNFTQQSSSLIYKLVPALCRHSECSFTCTKYGRKDKKGNTICRMRYPREMVAETTAVNGKIQCRRNDTRVTPHNKWILISTKANHDIQYIGSGQEAVAIAFYICNYMTKSDMSSYNTSTLIQKAMEARERDRSKDVGDIQPGSIDDTRRLIIKAVLKLSTHEEQSAVHVAACLLGLPIHYTSHQFKILYLPSFIKAIREASPMSPEEEEEEQLRGGIKQPIAEEHDVTIGDRGEMHIRIPREEYENRPMNLMIMVYISIIFGVNRTYQ